MALTYRYNQMLCFIPLLSAAGGMEAKGEGLLCAAVTWKQGGVASALLVLCGSKGVLVLHLVLCGSRGGGVASTLLFAAQGAHYASKGGVWGVEYIYIILDIYIYIYSHTYLVELRANNCERTQK